MKEVKDNLDRRNFIKTSAALTTGLLGLTGFQTLEAHSLSTEEDLFVIGPIDGYPPLIGTLISMLNYNRQTIINTVKSLTMKELDYLHDPSANTIGALILHLGATDKFYQINTFEGRQEFNDGEKKIWDAPMNLGDEGRKQIKGKEVSYYLDMINEVRKKTIEELKKKDDKWLLAIDPEWSKERPLNTYWKWFHVCEHESNHRGQMTWLKSRLPGAKPGRE
ncbi:MAG TPA: DinB family protein [Chryseolinea sp.]|nr:DinB family protein [Chryseolinea sp.]HPM30705.1 DinB family protein [Chryseolinea sp.]